MRDVALVTGREFTERIRSRTFLISNGVIMLLLALSFVLPILFSDDGPTRLGVVGPEAAAVAEAAVAEQDAHDLELHTVQLADQAAAEAAVDAGEVDVALLDGGTALVERSLDRQVGSLLRNAANAVAMERRLADAGLDAAERRELFAIEPLSVRSRTDDGDEVDPFSPEVIVAFFGVFMLYGLLIMYGQWVSQGIVEEKQSRVIELLLATVRPVELLAGKIIGLGLLGLVQVLLLVGVGVAGITLTDAFELPSSGYGALALVVAWFVLGYLIYATLFAMAGAVVSRVEDLQSAVMPVIFVLILAIFGAQMALNDPTSTLATVAGLVPFTAPMVQPVLAASGTTSVVEMLVAALLAIATIAVLLPLCARIYRGGVLATRGRVSFRDAWRSTRSPATGADRAD